MPDGLFTFLQFFVERFDHTDFDERLNAVSSRLDALTAQQQQTNDLLRSIMATLQQFTDALSRIDTATTAAAQVLQDIRDKVAQLEANAGIDAQQEASVLGQLDSVANALEQMGKSPDNPVPVEPGTPGNPPDSGTPDPQPAPPTA
jgi:septal ring factor EnvC (AmiA/AmiB activator)